MIVSFVVVLDFGFSGGDGIGFFVLVVVGYCCYCYSYYMYCYYSFCFWLVVISVGLEFVIFLYDDVLVSLLVVFVSVSLLRVLVCVVCRVYWLLLVW